MKRTLISLVAVLFMASSPAAELPPQIVTWATGPVKWLMTRDEAKQWQSIRTEADAQAFIALFWARRDPTPDTPRNETFEDFQARVALADQTFGASGVAGSMSDRGRVFILLGAPEQVSGRAGNRTISSLGGGLSVPTDSQGGILLPRPVREEDRQVWTYAHGKKPKYVPQPDFVIVFLDNGGGDWQLAHTERTNPEAILAEAVNGLIVNPKLMKAPVFTTPRPAAFKNAELKTAYDQFRSGSNGTIGPATLTDGEFVTDDGVHFLAAQMYVPAGNAIAAGQKVTFLSVVEDVDGKVIEVREDPATMTASGDDAYVDKSLRLGAGAYNVTFAIADGSRILAAAREPVRMEGIDPSAPSLSPLILSTNIQPLKTTWYATDPYTFGGLKVVPKGDAIFRAKGDLWYFIEVRNPGINAAGAPYVRVKLSISGQTANGPVNVSLPVRDNDITRLEKEKNRYALGLAIPLEGFLPGDYSIKVHVTDTVLGKDYDLEKAFKIRG